MIPSKLSNGFPPNPGLIHCVSRSRPVFNVTSGACFRRHAAVAWAPLIPVSTCSDPAAPSDLGLPLHPPFFCSCDVVGCSYTHLCYSVGGKH